jgi:uncharacterized iron-regulated protein
MQIRISLTIILIFSFIFTSLSQEFAYKLYTSKARKVSYAKMLKSIEKSDIILFGEYHNNPISHWLQLELTKSLGKTRKLTLGAEMLEADNQEELNKYLKDEIDKIAFDTLVRLWPNYNTDYSPLVDYALENNISFIATNIPRRYASMVYHSGFKKLDSLSDKEKQWIAPLPIKYDSQLPGYKKIVEMMGGHGGDNLPKAQAIKDATMAHFIINNLKENHLFLHYNGAFHSDNYEGILWYLKKEKPDLAYFTITTVLQKDINKLDKENIGLADYIICVDSDMTNTH